jgi:hypothetical protein
MYVITLGRSGSIVVGYWHQQVFLQRSCDHYRHAGAQKSQAPEVYMVAASIFSIIIAFFLHIEVCISSVVPRRKYQITVTFAGT